MNNPLFRTRPSEQAFSDWLENAVPGEVIEYHRGFLALDIDETASNLAPEDRLLLAATAAAAYRAADRDGVHLFQRRLASNCFSYLAVRSRPRLQVKQRVQPCSR
jgi:hypothetical protein